MAWAETFHCDVCNKEKSETLSPAEGEREQPVVKVTPWNGFLAHSADVQHLCGARCVHTIMDRWMLAK